MSTSSVQHLLKKINYIEAEVEIQKQILFSLPSDQTEEMEQVVAKIAQAKEEIDVLRAEIKAASPEEYQKILKIEQAAKEFQELATKKKFTSLENMTTDQSCSIELVEGREIQCLVKACDEQGDWTIITTEGDIQTFSKDNIKPEPQGN